MMKKSSVETSKPERRYDLDWLRVLAVLVLVPYHTARIFDIWEPFYVENERASTVLTYTFVGAVNPWHMPLFFLLAGAATWFALRFRSGGQYLIERLKRLVVPLAFGVLVLVPPQAYVGAVSHGNFGGSLFQYYPHFFQLGPSGDLTGYVGGFTPAHLWFILFLFVLSLVALPLLLYLRREAGQCLIARLAAFLARPGAIFLLAVPLTLALALPDVGGKNPFYDLILFIYGYVLMADARFEQALDRHKTPALVMGLGILLALVVIAASGAHVPGWLELIMDVSYRSLVTWFLLIAILGFGRKYLNFTTPALKYASEVAYPFYLLHQTVIVIIGFFVVQWDGGVLAKFLAIVMASMAAIALAVEVLVKQTNLTRFLFGMRLRSRPGRSQVAVGEYLRSERPVKTNLRTEEGSEPAGG
jgi:glucan biosynthesis protein C